MSKKVSYLTGINVLVELLNTDEMTGGGLFISQNKTENDLVRGTVKNKGPGFLLPFPKNHEDDVAVLLNETRNSPIYLPLDVEIGDTVYFPKGSMEPIILDGKQYHIVSYPAIKVFTRDENR